MTVGRKKITRLEVSPSRDSFENSNPTTGKSPRKRHFRTVFFLLPLGQAAQHDNVAVAHQNRSVNRAFAVSQLQADAGRFGRQFLLDLQADDIVGVDLWLDFQRQADIAPLVSFARVRAGAGGAGLNGDIVADDNRRLFVVLSHNRRRRNDARVALAFHQIHQRRETLEAVVAESAETDRGAARIRKRRIARAEKLDVR